MASYLKRTLIIILIFIILVPAVLAEVIPSIQIKDSFSVGQEIYFDYQILSDQYQEVTFVPYIFCPESSSPLAKKKIILVNSSLPFSNNYSFGILDSSFRSQNCSASLQILSPSYIIISKKFSIIAEPSFAFELKLGKKVFLLDEEIKIDFTSDIMPEIQANLIYPDKTSKGITLPYSFKVPQIGTYNIEVTASKEGYKTITKTEQFGVIEKNANIRADSIAPTIEASSNGESIGNMSFSGEQNKGNKNYWTYVVISIIAVLAIFIVFVLVRKLNNAF